MDPARFTIKKRDTVRSVREFVGSIGRLRHSIHGEKLWYRGQSDSEHELLPTIGRPQQYAGRNRSFVSEHEQQLLHRFRRRIASRLGRPTTAGEAIFLARHHGLPTRLLDWTANALYGLYFACYQDYPQGGEQGRSGVLWAMRRIRDSVDLNAFKLAEIKTEEELLTRPRSRDAGDDPGQTDDAIKIVHPSYDSERILAQDGAFTYHSNPWLSIERYEGIGFRRERLDIADLFRWEIPLESKCRLLEELSGLGITHRMLFPDLDGIARSLWETEVLHFKTPAQEPRA